MVVSAHPESSRIGAAVLINGGNAVDAAVATEFALAVCYPEAGNIGGGGFMLIRMSDSTSEVIDYREKAPLKASRDMYLGSDGNVIEGLSTGTSLASGVPGTVDGMIRAHSKYGKLPFKDVIQPAIDLARNGFPLAAEQARSLNSNRKNFTERNLRGPAFVGDTAWKTGDILKQIDLAATLERIRDNGREGFYGGTTARLIVEEMKRGNGLITMDDLVQYSSESREPLKVVYKDCTIITVPPPSSGGITLIQLLKMTENFPLKEWGFHSVKSIHLIAEAERRAFADRSEYAGDPGFVKVPVTGLFKQDYLKERMKDFSEINASLSSFVSAGFPFSDVSEETTHYSVVDENGNSVSATTTLNGTFGTSIVVDGAGFLLNNQMDDFSLKPGFPNMYGLIGGEANSIRPGKRMLSSMTPVIVEKEGQLFLILGSPGGSTIPTTVFQVITNIIDYGMDLMPAVDTGRFHHQWLPDRISYEEGSLDSATIRKLHGMGHTMTSRIALGRVNAIMVMKTGELKGTGDKRGYNSACGY
jgi:gamma-glutamyltranspeptidase/glutathione hydrolase